MACGSSIGIGQVHVNDCLVCGNDVHTEKASAIAGRPIRAVPLRGAFESVQAWCALHRLFAAKGCR